MIYNSLQCYGEPGVFEYTSSPIDFSSDSCYTTSNVFSTDNSWDSWSVPLDYSWWSVDCDDTNKRKSSVSDSIGKQLDFAIDNEFNVILKGKHGVGKTTRVLEKWKERGINYRYFSASTMDPFTDFIGVPKEQTDEHGNTYLGFVQPEVLHDPTVEALFFDEYNRSPKKVRNAVMELIQFKSINGRSFPNLKFIWAAVNPDDDDDHSYQVEIMDPAQADRFQMHIEVPYEVTPSYFMKRYPNGKGLSAINWWNDLAQSQKNLVSPRRLDAAMSALEKGATRIILSTILPNQINISEFIKSINSGSLRETVATAAASAASGDESQLTELVNGVTSKQVIDNLDEIVDGNEMIFNAICNVAEDETFVRIVHDFSNSVRRFMKGSQQHNERLKSVKTLKSVSDTVKNQIDGLINESIKSEESSNDVQDAFFKWMEHVSV